MLPARAQIVMFWGPEFVALYNDAYAPTIGVKHPKALGRPAREYWAELWDDLHPLLLRVLNTGETVFAEDRPFYIERHGYPENVFFDISYSPVRNEAGKVDGVLCIVSETTERVVAEERQRLLLQETNHRLKNIFAMIDALIGFSARSAPTPKEFAQILRGRLAALLRAKELARPGIAGDAASARKHTTVDALVQAILQPYVDDAFPERIRTIGPALPVGETAGTGLALALHETATNAVKYGALAQLTGLVRVTWNRRDDDFQLEWAEVGSSAVVAPPTSRGFGTILTENIVTKQLGGKLEYNWQPDGLKLTITAPMARLAV
ncbi:signal transduction histidine kinase [Rhodoplanes sp. Z2-YC6860]|nr:signal transduction histidine kinase [Rhodoplanes sp. Z2-YC6860]